MKFDGSFQNLNFPENNFIREFIGDFIGDFIRDFLRDFIRDFIRAFIRDFIRDFLRDFLRDFPRDFIRDFLREHPPWLQLLFGWREGGLSPFSRDAAAIPIFSSGGVDPPLVAAAVEQRLGEVDPPLARSWIW